MHLLQILGWVSAMMPRLDFCCGWRQVDKCWMTNRAGQTTEMAASLDGGTYVSATFAPAQGERPTVTRSHSALDRRSRPLQVPVEGCLAEPGQADQVVES